MPKKNYTGGWANYQKNWKGKLSAISVFISKEAHAKLKHKAYLEDRSVQKTARRIIEDAVKDVVAPPKDAGGSR
jgi:hypothetical protein